MVPPVDAQQEATEQAQGKAQLAAYNYAVRLLGGREFCQLEMHQRLIARAFDEDIVEEVIRQLQQDGYLSEMRFAESFLRSRMNRGEAPWLAAQRARQKGAQAEVVDMALQDVLADYDAQSVAQELIGRRDPAGRRFEDERVWQRHARFLRNKGFATDIILQVLKAGNPVDC